MLDNLSPELQIHNPYFVPVVLRFALRLRNDPKEESQEQELQRAGSRQLKQRQLMQLIRSALKV